LLFCIAFVVITELLDSFTSHVLSVWVALVLCCVFVLRRIEQEVSY
jgi:hypothetical protein